MVIHCIVTPHWSRSWLPILWIVLVYTSTTIYYSSKVNCYTWMAGSAEAPESTDMQKHGKEFLGLNMDSMAYISISPIFFQGHLIAVLLLPFPSTKSLYFLHQISVRRELRYPSLQQQRP